MNVLINRTDAIGDLILTVPIALSLKKYYPGARVTFLVSPRTKDILRHNPYVDEIVVYDKNWSWYKKLAFALKLYKNKNITHYFFIGGTHLFSFFAFIFLVKFRGGLKSRWPSFLFLNHGLRQKRATVEMHEAEYNLNLLSPLNSEISIRDLDQMFHLIFLGNEEKENVKKEFLKNYPQYENKKIVIIHPGMTGHTLNWPAQNYAQFVQTLNDQSPGEFLFVISSTPSDDKYLIPFKYEMEDYNSVINLIYYDGSSKGLRFFMNLISNASLFIGPSTGPTHIANALGIHTISIYSPIKVQSALRWSPFFKQNLDIFVPEVVCGENHKCAKELCMYYECMSKIEADDVALRGFEILKNVDKNFA